MRVDLNDQDDPAWLIVGASVEELREDIDDRFHFRHPRLGAAHSGFGDDLRLRAGA